MCLDHRGDRELMALVVVESRLEMDGWISWFFILLDSREEKKAPHVGMMMATLLLAERKKENGCKPQEKSRLD